MSRFFGRFLPPDERRTALWLALGGAGVLWIAGRVGGLAREQMSTAVLEEQLSSSSVHAVVALVEFAAVALVVTTLIRFARATKAIALYVALGALLGIALALLGVPAALLDARIAAAEDLAPVVGVWESGAAAIATQLGIGLGALAGAWIAATVSLARIRDTGFSGDAPDGKGLRSKPAGMGWSFVGWQGRPLTGDALLAVSFVAATAVVGLVAAALSLAAVLIPGRFEGGLAANATGVVFTVLLAVSWLLAARAVTLRYGVVSLWLVPLSAGLGSMVFVVESMSVLGSTGVSDVVGVSAVNLAAPLLTALAALGGVELALRRKPATISRNDPQDPDAGTASADTAGGTDG